MREQRLNHFAENILKTFKSYYSFKSFKSNSMMDDFIFQWICILPGSLFLFFICFAFFEWYADFKTENLKCKIKQKNA